VREIKIIIFWVINPFQALFLESISSSVGFKSFKCSSWIDFAVSRCYFVEVQNVERQNVEIQIVPRFQNVDITAFPISP
jgi:hypothetical protein